VPEEEKEIKMWSCSGMWGGGGGWWVGGVGGGGGGGVGGSLNDKEMRCLKRLEKRGKERGDFS